MPSYYEIIGHQHPGGPVAEGCPPAPDFKTTSLFLDLDGTLVELCDEPGEVKMPASLLRDLDVLCRLTEGATALVSGRDMADLRQLVPGFKGAMIAGQGAEWSLGDRVERHPLAGSQKVAQITAIVRAFTDTDPRLILEPKAAGVAVHCRRAPEMVSEVYKFLQGTQVHYPDFVVVQGKRDIEIRPAGLNRRDAVRDMSDVPPFRGRRPIYIGDDILDEQAMEFVVQRGGLAIKVGESESWATHRLHTPAEARDCLSAWCAEEVTTA